MFSKDPRIHSNCHASSSCFWSTLSAPAAALPPPIPTTTTTSPAAATPVLLLPVPTAAAAAALPPPIPTAAAALPPSAASSSAAPHQLTVKEAVARIAAREAELRESRVVRRSPLRRGLLLRSVAIAIALRSRRRCGRGGAPPRRAEAANVVRLAANEALRCLPREGGAPRVAWLAERLLQGSSAMHLEACAVQLACDAGLHLGRKDHRPEVVRDFKGLKARGERRRDEGEGGRREETCEKGRAAERRDE